MSYIPFFLWLSLWPMFENGVIEKSGGMINKGEG